MIVCVVGATVAAGRILVTICVVGARTSVAIAEAKDCNLGVLYGPSEDVKTSYCVVLFTTETRNKNAINQESVDVLILALL